MSQLFFSYPEDHRRKKSIASKKENQLVVRDKNKKQCNFYDISQAITYFLLDAISGHPITIHVSIACQRVTPSPAQKRRRKKHGRQFDAVCVLLQQCFIPCSFRRPRWRNHSFYMNYSPLSFWYPFCLLPLSLLLLSPHPLFD